MKWPTKQLFALSVAVSRRFRRSRSQLSESTSAASAATEKCGHHRIAGLSHSVDYVQTYDPRGIHSSEAESEGIGLQASVQGLPCREGGIKKIAQDFRRLSVHGQTEAKTLEVTLQVGEANSQYPVKTVEPIV